MYKNKPRSAGFAGLEVSQESARFAPLQASPWQSLGRTHSSHHLIPHAPPQKTLRPLPFFRVIPVAMRGTRIVQVAALLPWRPSATRPTLRSARVPPLRGVLALLSCSVGVGFQGLRVATRLKMWGGLLGRAGKCQSCSWE